jgi:hypothetical protein
VTNQAIAEKQETLRMEQIGEVAVDSGQVMILDPSSDGKVKGFPVPPGQLARPLTRTDSGVEVGVVSLTAVGDGCYPVSAVYEGEALRGLFVELS